MSSNVDIIGGNIYIPSPNAAALAQSTSHINPHIINRITAGIIAAMSIRSDPGAADFLRIFQYPQTRTESPFRIVVHIDYLLQITLCIVLFLIGLTFVIRTITRTITQIFLGISAFADFIIFTGLQLDCNTGNILIFPATIFPNILCLRFSYILLGSFKRPSSIATFDKHSIAAIDSYVFRCGNLTFFISVVKSAFVNPDFPRNILQINNCFLSVFVRCIKSCGFAIFAIARSNFTGKTNPESFVI